MARKRAKTKKRKLVKPIVPVKMASDGYKTIYEPTPDNQIRSWRIYRGFHTQDALARAAKLSRPNISRLESGIQQYNQEHLEVLARVLDCTPSDLISVNPRETDDIMKIYARLSAANKRAVDALIRSLHPATRDPKPDA